MGTQEEGLPQGVSVEKFGLEGLCRAQRHTSLSSLRAFPESVYNRYRVPEADDTST